MAIACKWCILTKGLKGSEIGSLPQTEEELYQHIECVHHIPVRRDGETVEVENPEAGGPNCRCPGCQRKQAERN